MYLSRLEIVGFKSFAQKTKLTFHDGITGIVGPNGCGKSNVVDAIRWVLGEQRSSTLRSDKMEDVIFNGTKNRKPMGLSEVSMTIENSKGILPSEYSEITITRRLFRNGESNYLLNKTICRLRDIVNLFMDTGMGSNAYSVIELKMIETILSDRHEERRRLFEEASGITKYKSRRKEAERRLKDIQTDLARVQDILLEVQKTVRSLSRQASKAKRYSEIKKEIETLERRLLEYEYAGILAELAPLETRRKETTMQRATLDTELIEQETVVSEMEEDQSRVEIRLSEAEARLGKINRLVSDTGRELAVGRERFNSLDTSRERTLQEQKELEHAITSIENNLKESEHRKDILADRVAEAEKEFTARKKIQDECMEHVQQVRGQARQAKSKVMSIMDSINALRATTERNKARIESLRRRIQETGQLMATTEQRKAELGRELETQRALKPQLESDVKKAEKALADVQEYQKKLNQEVESLQEEISAHQNELSHKRAALEFLTGLVDSNESSDFLMEHADWRPNGERIILSEAVSADEQVRTAVAAALGNATEYFVVDTMQEARAGIHALKQNNKGKVTFICLEKVPAMPAPPPAPQHKGVFGWVSEIVRTEERLRNTLRGLLGRTLVVDTLETAWQVVNEGMAECAVSLDGELVRQSGVLVRGGGVKSTEGAIIGKGEQIEELRKAIEALESRIRELTDKRNGRRGEYSGINLRVYSDAIRKAESELARYEQQLNKLNYQFESSDSALAEAQENIEKFEAEIKAIEAHGNDKLPELRGMEAQKEQAETDLENAEYELRQAEEQFDEDSAEAHRAEMRLVQLRGEEKSLSADLDRLNNQLHTTRQRLEHRGRELEHTDREKERLREELLVMEQRLEEYRMNLEDAQKERDIVAEEQAALRKSIHEQANILRSKRRAFDECKEILHETELQLSRLRSSAEQCKRRAQEEFDMELSKTPPGPEEGEEEFNMDAARLNVRDLKQKLNTMGAVNLLAFEEFEKESERQDFLQSQLDDLTKSENTLNETIREINQTAKEKFQETFDQIRGNFINIFQNLFEEGDEADLLLDEGDPLEARVEIIAKPRGKRPHSIDMLSGGEKTLTAIALLFAIYLVKPSPFCILDEVDAPLDDANIDRYLRIIREFSKNTQFIMITHNKLTMEAADTLFGVVMEEGVSQIVSVQMNGKEDESKIDQILAGETVGAPENN